MGPTCEGPPNLTRFEAGGAVHGELVWSDLRDQVKSVCSHPKSGDSVSVVPVEALGLQS